ncbi:unnamed protein product [Amoebophrya sp. A120]|nr:unnamed protein product [Amoebophrya sp. A120]|eukprot:GSA120T00002105001.1
MGAEESKPTEDLQEIERRLLEHARVPVKVRDLLLPRAQESIHYAQCEGRGEIGNGLPLVVIHGYGGGVGVYYRIMKFMVERWSGPIYFLDLPGMGCSMRKERHFESPEDVEHFFIKRLRFWLDSVIPWKQEPGDEDAAENGDAYPGVGVQPGSDDRAGVIPKMPASSLQGEGESAESSKNQGPLRGGAGPAAQATSTTSKSTSRGNNKNKKGRTGNNNKTYEKFVLVAHSFGGYISTAFANTVKDRLAGLILLSPCFGFPKTRMPKESEKGYKEQMIEALFDGMSSSGGPSQIVKGMGSWGGYFFRSWVRTRFATPPPEAEFDALVDYLVGINYDASPGTESSLFAVFGRFLTNKAELPLIERVDLEGVPLISFFGDDDWMDKQGASYLGDIGVISGCTHQMHMEYPRLVTRCIMYFVKHNIDARAAQDGKINGAPSMNNNSTGATGKIINGDAERELQEQDLAVAGYNINTLTHVMNASQKPKLRSKASFELEAPSDDEGEVQANDENYRSARERAAQKKKTAIIGNTGMQPALSVLAEKHGQNRSKTPPGAESATTASSNSIGPTTPATSGGPQQRGPNIIKPAPVADVRTFHGNVRASIGGRTPAVYIVPVDGTVTKEELQMIQAPTYSKRPYKKVLKIKKRAPVWWIPNETSEGVADIREFRPDYDPELLQSAAESEVDESGDEGGRLDGGHQIQSHDSSTTPHHLRQPKIAIDIKMRRRLIEDNSDAATGAREDSATSDAAAAKVGNKEGSKTTGGAITGGKAGVSRRGREQDEQKGKAMKGSSSKKAQMFRPDARQGGKSPASAAPTSTTTLSSDGWVSVDPLDLRDTVGLDSDTIRFKNDV